MVFDEGQENFSFVVHFPDAGAQAVGFNRLVDIPSVVSVEINDQIVTDFSPLTDAQRLSPNPSPEQAETLDTSDSLPGNFLTFGDYTLIPDSFRYDPMIGSGLLHCRIQVPKDHSNLILDDYFLPEQSGLKASQLGHWYVETDPIEPERRCRQ